MKRFFLIALIVSVSAGIVFAQVDVPGNAYTSPQSTATSGRLRSNADNFIRADAYSGIKFDKFFTMVGYSSSGSSSQNASLGFAAKAGGLYIGAYYGGTFWANIPNVSYTEAYGTWLGDPNANVRSYTLPTIVGGSAPSNNLSLLFGFLDMGVRLSLFTDKEMFSDTNFKSGGTQYSSYDTEDGGFTPQLLWSMSKSLTSIGIQPYVAVTLDFDRNYTKSSTYSYDAVTASYVAGPASITSVKNGTTNNGITNNENKITANVGLGGVTLVNKNGFKFSADLDYKFDITIYDNEYTYNDLFGDTYIRSGFQGTLTGGKYVEQGTSTHTITPSLSGQWSGGPLSFRFKVNLNVPITASTSTSNMLNPDGSGSLLRDGSDSSSINVGFNPDIRLAAQWKIIPQLTLNLGGRINFSTISSTTNTTTYTSGIINDNSSSTTVNNTNPTSITNSLAMGLTINATDNLTFELASGASNGIINVFGNASGTNGLLFFTNLLVALRY